MFARMFNSSASKPATSSALRALSEASVPAGSSTAFISGILNGFGASQRGAHPSERVVGGAELLASTASLGWSMRGIGYSHETLGRRTILNNVIAKDASALLKEGRDDRIEVFLESWESKLNFEDLKRKDPSLFDVFDNLSKQVRHQSILAPKQPNPSTPRADDISRFRPR